MEYLVILSGISTFFYFAFSFFILFIGLKGYSRTKRTEWILIGIYGAVNFLDNVYRFFIRYEILKLDLNEDSAELLSGTILGVHFLASVLLIAGLFMLGNNKPGKKEEEIISGSRPYRF